MYRVARLPMHGIDQSVALFVECPMDRDRRLQDFRTRIRLKIIFRSGSGSGPA